MESSCEGDRPICTDPRHERFPAIATDLRRCPHDRRHEAGPASTPARRLDAPIRGRPLGRGIAPPTWGTKTRAGGGEPPRRPPARAGARRERHPHAGRDTRLRGREGRLDAARPSASCGRRRTPRRGCAARSAARAGPSRPRARPCTSSAPVPSSTDAAVGDDVRAVLRERARHVLEQASPVPRLDGDLDAEAGRRFASPPTPPA